MIFLVHIYFVIEEEGNAYVVFHRNYYKQMSHLI